MDLILVRGSSRGANMQHSRIEIKIRMNPVDEFTISPRRLVAPDSGYCKTIFSYPAECQHSRNVIK